MDIQVPSNFERALFEASNRDHVWLSQAMKDFARERALNIPSPALASLRSRYQACSVSDNKTLDTITEAHRCYGRLIDPHTAVALAASRKTIAGNDIPNVVLATAHPAKFPETVSRATGVVPPLPPRLARSYLGPERYSVLPNDAHRLRAFIEARALNHEC